MDQPKEKTELTIMIDPKHKTEYYITPNRCYIKTNISVKGKNYESYTNGT